MQEMRSVRCAGRRGLQIVTLASVVEQPWTNHWGSTCELWLERDAGGAIRLRISVAMLTRPAPFSVLPGLSRSFMPLDDIDAELAIDGMRVPVGQHDPVRFNGDAVTSLVALSRPGRALNLMSDARCARHTLFVQPTGTAECHAVLALVDWQGSLPLRAGDLVLSLGASVALGGKSAIIHLEHGDGV